MEIERVVSVGIGDDGESILAFGTPHPAVTGMVLLAPFMDWDWVRVRDILSNHR